MACRPDKLAFVDGKAEPWQTAEQLAGGYIDFQACEVRAKAVVRSIAEGEVLIRFSREIDGGWSIEDGWVAIGATKRDDHSLTFGYHRAGERQAF